MGSHSLLCRTLFTLTLVGLVGPANAYGQAAENELPKAKQTSLGLYVTAKEAYDLWKTGPDQVKVLDVRTPEEYIFVGHATMAVNIPAFLQTLEWDEEKHRFSMVPNPDFRKQVQATFEPDDTILVMCRSGGRSAMAVNQLAAAGFKNVYNITDGMEGDKVAEPGSLYHGQRMKNGWKNSGAPWTYSLDPELMRLPGSR
jgi:rhodanese-related sulfurtransferase